MRRLGGLAILALVLIVSFPGQATKVNQKDIEATNIVVGLVEDVAGYYDVNEWGDELIFSRVEVRVDNNIKGRAEHRLAFSVEGGQVGDLALHVSESPVLTRGESVKLYLKKELDTYSYIDHQSLGKTEGSAPQAAPGCCATFAHWTNEPVFYYINPANRDISPACAADDINAGAASWSTAFNLQYAGATVASRVKQDYVNEIFFRKGKRGSTIAVTYTWYYTSTGQIIEFDMAFYDGAWDFVPITGGCKTACNGGFYLRTIAAHELGHGIGLDHNNCTTSIMYPYADYCETNLPDADDIACAKTLYH
jgi:hypothetical protein